MKANSVSKLNPLIADTPAETISNATNALEWLENLTPKVADAFGGEPIDAIAYGRFLLGQCCIAALEAATEELLQQPRKAKKAA